ncbi:class I SAM-dependent methyltransferase [Roseateles koreensis]|uniref:Methyltransferase n=1 Tax=Roseateles koreensis TaxID=2987526 RepID=A0ABT5KST3_9BURK|nr:methyltransferase [Roseateles koreensis]MDC8785408.1 methyltransferase [Roseateles koreensis]
MKQMICRAMAAAAAVVGLSVLASPAFSAEDAALRAAIAGAQRSPAFVARDGWRHPYETLTFFGLHADQVVVELSPGGGWYTEILAPYLREHGRLVLAGDDPASSQAYYQRSAARLTAKLAATPAVYDRVQLTVFDPAAGKLSYAAAGSADLVLTFRNVHNWVAQGEAVTQAAFKSAFEVLKPGGVLGVVEHRLPPNMPQGDKAESGYLHQAYVIRMAEGVGFKWVGSSEINANPRDNANHEGGVWALPPILAHKDADRASYEAIGESDRMTLKFIKP